MAATVHKIAEEETETSSLPPLRGGEQMDQWTFHARYQAMPPGFKAELVGGTVHLMSPVSRPHWRPHVGVITWLSLFEEASPGIEVMDNATVILGEKSEPQPDSGLRVLAAHGGNTTIDEDGYIVGPPELVVEVSVSRTAYDLGQKKVDYEAAGVQEYLVLLPKEESAYWFYLVDGRYQWIEPDQKGVLRSKRFPGLWLDPRALLNRDSKKVRRVLRQGLGSPEHQVWVLEMKKKK